MSAAGPYPVIAIDGPAASGKGTLAKGLAQALNFAHMDTGGLYRAVAWIVLSRNDDPADPDCAERAAKALSVNFKSEVLDNPALRDDTVAAAASKLAAFSPVRLQLLELQRHFARQPGGAFKGAVLDGRDIGTVVCPNAEIKLFVTASVEIRSQRRLKELQSKGIETTYEAVLKDMQERDARDTTRAEAPMVMAKDAILVDSSALNAPALLAQALEIAKARLGLSGLQNTLPGQIT